MNDINQITSNLIIDRTFIHKVLSICPNYYSNRKYRRKGKLRMKTKTFAYTLISMALILTTILPFAPTFMGFALAATYGEDDIWDVAATFEGERGPFELQGAIAYTQSTDENGLDGFGGRIDNSIVVGSLAVLHKPSGLNALVAAGHQTFDEQVVASDGVTLTPRDAKYIYTKLGWIAEWSSLGSTAFYTEYGYFKDFAPADLDGEAVASVAAGGVCAIPGNCRISASEAQAWGLGVVQWIDPAEMQIYLGYRNFQADLDLTDSTGTNEPSEGLKDFQAVKLGAIIAF